ncbi:MAG: glutamate formimidoyltransferase [Eubacteriales bacterium]|nr:glutamate formimidoyltransferase [Eubacteriales bacterium]
MSNQLIECVPNFSNGRDPEVMQQILAPFFRNPEIRVLDYSQDADHNRGVVTLIGSPEALEPAIVEAVGVAARLIDLRKHHGAHPRMGATDVIPFVPIRNCTVQDCDELAKRVGKRIGEEHKIPVYLYEDSATSPNRKNLAKIRKGEFEGFADKIREDEWKPDFGPQEIHPSAGVVAIGARQFLIAYNINLDTDKLEIADAIAKKVRFVGGGFRFVKAMGVELHERNQVQVSMNLTNFEKSHIYQVFEAVKMEARRYGVNVVGSEVIGLAPMAALLDTAAYYLQLEGFTAEQVIETRLLEQ